eukprot:XP_028346779.1 lysophospholipid acyltransferase 5-like isoform X3 [Physeter catodon]
MASAAEGDVGAVAELATVLRWGFQDLSLNKLATSLGASEQALRLIISIFLDLHLLPFPGGSKCGLGTSSISSPRNSLDTQILRSTPNRLNEKLRMGPSDLRFNKPSRLYRFP